MIGKWIILASVLTLLSPVAGRAQSGDKPHINKEEFDNQCNAFIIAELGLTPEEAAAFIPLCNEYRQKKFEAGRNCRWLLRNLRKEDKPAESRYIQAMDCCIEADVQTARLAEDYYKRFKEVLPAANLFKYKDTEQRFTRQFMQRRGHGKPE
ncbi:MAG: hypothetical protein LBB27_00060 [Tannerellaceae bacterium]|nr:hypothetical protein [Tannerellaceae bacterium]